LAAGLTASRTLSLTPARALIPPVPDISGSGLSENAAVSGPDGSGQNNNYFYSVIKCKIYIEYLAYFINI
jgi:hypothetical protein